MSDNKPHKAVSYVRFSSKKQMKGNSLTRQTEKAQQWIASRPDLNLVLDNSVTFHDLGVSAFRGKNAKEGELSEFLEAVKSGLIERGTYLLVEHLDRVSRLPFRKAARVLEDICDMDINVVTLNDNTIYTKDSDLPDYIRAALAFETANRESVRKSELSADNWRKLRKKAATGVVMSSNNVSWLDVIGEKPNRQFAINEEKASIVKMIVAMFLSGKGCQAIATALNVSGVPSLRNGKQWEPRSIHSLLSNPALCGVYSMGDKAIAAKEEPIPNYYPALISTEKFNEISLMLNRGNVKSRDPVANPVAGICYCSVCGSKMTRFKTRSHGERVICAAAKVRKCAGGYRTIKLDIVYDRLKLIVMHPQTFAAHWPPGGDNRKEIVRLRFIQADLETKISNVTEAMMMQGHSPALGASLRALEAEKATVDGQIEKQASLAVLSGHKAIQNRLVDVRDAIEANDIPLVNGLMRRLFDKVVVNVRERTIEAVWIGQG
jgi:DNA invertase Pin-like site-specific DNA recombinase